MGSETRYISSWNDGEAMSRMWTRTVIACQKNRWVKLSLLPYFEHEKSHIHFKRQYLTPPSPQLDYRGGGIFLKFTLVHVPYCLNCFKYSIVH
jgi:hypothetical protein